MSEEIKPLPATTPYLPVTEQNEEERRNKTRSKKNKQSKEGDTNNEPQTEKRQQGLFDEYV